MTLPHRRMFPSSGRFYTTRCERTVPSAYGCPNTRIEAPFGPGRYGRENRMAFTIRYVFKGTLKGNEVNGTYITPLGGTGEYFVAKGRFYPATKSFVGKLSFMGKCRGTSTVRAKKV